MRSKDNRLSHCNIKAELQRTFKKNEIIISFNIFNNVSISGVLRAAKEVQRPVMLGVTEPDLAHFGLEELVPTFRAKVERAGVPAVLHLDHGMSLDTVVRCICAGFGSVMIDPSNIPVDKRIQVVREVVDFAAPMNVMVESIIGQLKLASRNVAGEGASPEELTDPDAVAEFVANTGIDLLAVSVGTEHGTTYAGKKAEVDMARLKAIAGNVSLPLVVHGGSGVSHEQLRQLRANRVGKMNIGGAIRMAYTEAIITALQRNPRMNMPEVEAIGEEAIYRVALQKLKALSC